jgi:hypothetical protein
MPQGLPNRLECQISPYRMHPAPGSGRFLSERPRQRPLGHRRSLCSCATIRFRFEFSSILRFFCSIMRDP